MLKFSVLLISWAIHRSFDFTFLFIYYCIKWNIMFVIRPVNSRTCDENVYMFSDCNHLLLLLCYRCTRFPGNGQQNVGKHQRIVWDEFSAKITFAFNNDNNNGSGGLIRCCVQYVFLFSHFAHVYQTGKKRRSEWASKRFNPWKWEENGQKNIVLMIWFAEAL